MVSIADSLPYISGMGYRSLCDFHYDDFSTEDLKNIDQFNGMKFFVKTDLINQFENKALPFLKNKFYLYCHNSDLDAPSSLNLLNHPLLIHCYSQNVSINHKKLSSIPIGLANRHWPHGDIETLKSVQDKQLKKTNLLYTNFSIETNTQERQRCQSFIGFNQIEKLPFSEYLKNIAQSLFCASPKGNGIDCHRNWECLYLKTVPIVTESININFYKNYPFLIIKDWSEFPNLHLSESLYKKLWENFDSNLLYM